MNFKDYLKKYKEKMGVSNEYIAKQLGVIVQLLLDG